MTPSAPPAGPTAGQIMLRYWAAAAAAAGVSSDVLEVNGPSTLGELKELALSRHGSVRFRDVLSCCSVLVGDRPVGRADEVVVEPGATVEFLPPFAGG